MTLLLLFSNRIRAFQEACRLGVTDVVQTFLAGCTDNKLMSETDANEELNALQIAVKNKRSHIVQILLRRYKTLIIKCNIFICHDFQNTKIHKGLALKHHLACNILIYHYYATILPRICMAESRGNVATSV